MTGVAERSLSQILKGIQDKNMVVPKDFMFFRDEVMDYKVELKLVL